MANRRISCNSKVKKEIPFKKKARVYPKQKYFSQKAIRFIVGFDHVNGTQISRRRKSVQKQSNLRTTKIIRQ
jgi:hypothetical protein